MMQRLVTVRWESPPPTSVDEELAAYDDGTVWLVVRGSRDGSATIGTWSLTPTAEKHAALVASGDSVVDVRHADEVSETAELLRSAALAEPVATAKFVAARGEGPSVTLAAIGGGTRPIELELQPDSVTVHVEVDGVTRAWFQADPPVIGFVTRDAVGLGGLGWRAEIPPGTLGAILLEVPGIEAVSGDAVAVALSGWLAEGLPDQQLPLPFRVRTAAG
jgi:hypothetical protein